MEVPQHTPATQVQTHNPSGDAASSRRDILHMLANVYHRQLFLGNAGQIDYARLGRRREEVEHTTTQITSAVGSVVGVHEFLGKNKENEESNVIVVLAHGNTRPTRYMRDLIEPLLQCDIKAVVGRDFVGYDASSQVPYQNGALEIAAQANDIAAMGYVSEKYPGARVVLCGRSIGTFLWTGHLHHPKVLGAIGIVPLTNPSSLLTHRAKTLLPSFVCQAVGASNLASVSHSLPRAAMPSGWTSTQLPGFTTRGFELDAVPAGVQGKSVVLFPARDDDWIPAADAERLHQMLDEAGCNVTTVWNEGDHRALPTQAQLKDALDNILG